MGCVKTDGHRVAIAAGVLAVGMVAAAAVAARVSLAERWYIWRLGSGDFAARFHAARKLGDLRTQGAIPGLVALWREGEGHDAEAKAVAGPKVFAAAVVAEALAKIGQAAIPEVERVLKETSGEKKTWRRSACTLLGGFRTREAVPALTDMIDDGFLCVRVTALAALRSMGADAAGAVPALTRALQDPDRTVRGGARSALLEIQGVPR